MTSSLTPLSRLSALTAVGTSVWLDALSRDILGSGELEQLVREHDVSGVTANPSIFEQAILGSTAYDERLAALAGQGRDVVAAYEALAVEDVRAAADVLRPVYERTNGLDGFASLEVAPDLAHDADATFSSVRELWQRLDRPNVMIKIPGTRAGAEAIRRSISAGININVTLLFSVDAYAAVAEAYLAGLEERLARGEPIDRVASVASFFVSRVDTAVDRLLAARGRADLAGQVAVANARVAYARFRELFGGERFARLAARGARSQRPLWASTGVKNPRLCDVHYVEQLAGPDTITTMPLATLHAFADHGVARDTLTGATDTAARTLAELRQAGIALEDVTDELLREGIEAFELAMGRLLLGIEQRRQG